MAFDSVTARKMLSLRGGRATAKLMRPLGFPNLVKARESWRLNRLRLGKAQGILEVSVLCERDCPCRQRHTVTVDELTPMEKAIIGGMSLAKLKAYKVTDNLR